MAVCLLSQHSHSSGFDTQCCMNWVGTGVHACNTSTWEQEAREEVQGHPWLHSKFEACLGYTRSYPGPKFK